MTDYVTNESSGAVFGDNGSGMGRAWDAADAGGDRALGFATDMAKAIFGGGGEPGEGVHHAEVDGSDVGPSNAPIASRSAYQPRSAVNNTSHPLQLGSSTRDAFEIGRPRLPSKTFNQMAAESEQHLGLDRPAARNP